MSEHEYKNAAPRQAFAQESPPDSASLPARSDQSGPAAFLNPAPKAALLGLALLLMAGYAHFMIGFSALTPELPPPPPPVVLPPGAPPATPPAATPTTPTPQPETPPQVAPDDSAAQAHREKIARLGKTPRLMSAQTFASDNLDGVSLQNSTVNKAVFQASSVQNAAFYKMRFKDCAFTDVDLSKANIREVTFEDCVFENSNIDEATLFNVNFINCSFSGTKYEQGVSKARVAVSRMYNVLFENARLDGFELFMNSGRVTFTGSDLTALRLGADGNNQHFPKVSAGTVQFRLNLEKCTGGDFKLEVRGLASELKISGSDFENVKLGNFSKIQIDDSRVTGQGFIDAREWLVVTNSTLCASFRSYGPMYFVNNSYVSERSPSRVNAFIKDDDGMRNTSKLQPAEGALCYIIGGGDDAWLTTFGGKLNISNLKIRYAYFELDNSTRASSELNLKNVSLETAHIYNSDLDNAYWENVSIAKPMTSRNIRSQKPLAVRMVNVTLPQGEWIDSNTYSIEEVMPRKWPQPEIPELK